MSSPEDTRRPTIARICRGRTTSDRASESEFVTVSYWENVPAMSEFAGEDPTRIHHLDRVPGFPIELPKGVQILTLVLSSSRCTVDSEKRRNVP
jgi:hypothetical protein